MKKHLSPEQTAELNRTLRHLADDLERNKAAREEQNSVETRVPVKPKEVAEAK
jgi:hypothetical protein